MSSAIPEQANPKTELTKENVAGLDSFYAHFLPGTYFLAKTFKKTLLSLLWGGKKTQKKGTRETPNHRQRDQGRSSTADQLG